MSGEQLTPSDTYESLSVREMLDTKQAHLDYVMQELSEEVAMWNLRMADLAARDDEAALHELREVAREAAYSLDSKWPFMHDQLHVSGSWYSTRFATTNSTIEFPMEKEEAFNILPSNGFSVFEPEDEPPMVGLSFLVQDVPVISAAIQGHLTVLNYALPHEVSLYYVRPNNAEVTIAADLETLHHDIQYYDNLLMLHYENASSDFYRKSAKQQKKFMLDIVDKISDNLPAPEYGVRAKCEMVTTPYVYRRIENGGQRIWQKVSSSDGGAMMLAGDVDGVSVLESSELDGGKPLRGKHELIDADAGICLVLQVEQCSVPDIFNNQPVYIPMRQAEEIELSIP